MKPLIGYIKINFDVAISNGGVGYGVIVRDSDGFVTGGCYGFKEKQLDAIWAEIEAFVESMQLATTLNAPNIIF